MTFGRQHTFSAKDAELSANSKKANPLKREKYWFWLTILVLLLTVAGVTYAAFRVFSLGSIANQQRAAQAISPFMVAGGALVTFCTVVWRGMVTTRQADEQRRQNDAKDEENLAKLLVDGTKLAAEDPSKQPTQVQAGIAALQAIACAENGRFAVPAMDMLVDIVLKTSGIIELDHIDDAAIAALRSGALKGRRATRSIILRGQNFEFGTQASAKDSVSHWKSIAGPPTVTYRGGWTSPFWIESTAETQLIFEGTYIYLGEVNMKASYGDGCRFERCQFEGTVSAKMIRRNHFKDCDFSSATFVSGAFGPSAEEFMRDIAPRLQGNGNFFDKARRPRIYGEMDVAEFLDVH